MLATPHTAFGTTVLGALLLAASCAVTESLPDDPGKGGGTDAAGGAASHQDGGRGSPPPGNLDAGPGQAGQAGSAPVGDAEACAHSSATAEAVPAVIDVLLDTSGSMRWIPGENREPQAGERSKLEITREALQNAFDAMPDETAVGLSVYPGREDDVAGDCLAQPASLEIAPLTPEHRQRVSSALARTLAQGGTPTHDAYLRALAELESSGLAGDKYMVLITDGVPTYAAGCVGNGTDPVSLASVEAEAQSAQRRGVRTFVVGSPGSEGARAALSRVASLGATAQPGCQESGPNFCHFDMTTAADFAKSLNAALASIASQTLSCSYEIPAPPDGAELDRERVNVSFTSATGSERILRDPAAGSCREGWQYSADATRIVLCDATCERIQSQPEGKVEILFGCATEVRPPE